MPEDLQSLLPDNLALETDNPLWHFSLWFWHQPGMEKLSLHLQSQGVSVTRLLCALWLAAQSCRYSDDPPQVRQWRATVTEPLRLTRRRLPKLEGQILDLRRKVAESELQAEQIELALAFRFLPLDDAGQSPASTLKSNLRCAGILDFLSDQELSRLSDVLGPVTASDDTD